MIRLWFFEKIFFLSVFLGVNGGMRVCGWVLFNCFELENNKRDRLNSDYCGDMFCARESCVG